MTKTTKRTATKTVLTFAAGRCAKCGRKNGHGRNCRVATACKSRRKDVLAKRAA